MLVKEHRVKYEPETYAGGRINPTADDAVERSSPDLGSAIRHCISEHRLPTLKPMSIDRLRQADWVLSPEERARVLYDDLGDADAVADKLKQPRAKVRGWLAWDIEQRKLAKQNKAS